METSFRHSLEKYGSLVKKQMETEDEKELKKLDGEIDEAIEAESAKHRSSIETQGGVYDLQVEKQEIMADLEEALANLDNKEHRESLRDGDIHVVYTGGKYYAEVKGKVVPVTLGEIQSDGDWGVNYHLDPASVPRNVRKRYIIEGAKRKLRKLLDRQILINAVDSRANSQGIRETYARIENDVNAEFREGVVAERMVESLLKQVMYDSGADYEIRRGDLYEDVQQQIDFVIVRKHRTHGVEVQESDEEEVARVGIQFTVNNSPEVLQKKNEQLARGKGIGSSVDKKILVVIPSLLASKKYREWSRESQPGGPVRLWDTETKVTVFTELMEGLLEKDDFNRCIGLIRQRS